MKEGNGVLNMKHEQDANEGKAQDMRCKAQVGNLKYYQEAVMQDENNFNQENYDTEDESASDMPSLEDESASDLEYMRITESNKQAARKLQRTEEKRTCDEKTADIKFVSTAHTKHPDYTNKKTGLKSKRSTHHMQKRLDPPKMPSNNREESQAGCHNNR